MTLFALSALLLLPGQTMSAGPGDPLMKPAIPDSRLLLVDWVQDDLGLSQSEVIQIQSELNPPFDKLVSRAKSGASPPPALATESMLRTHVTRLRELSLWSADLQALVDPKIAATVGLSSDKQKRIAAAFRNYFLDYNEAAGLHPYIRGQTYTPPKTPDPNVFRKKVFVLRKTVRALLSHEDRVRFNAIKGRPPSVIGPFGWIYQTPSMFLPIAKNLILWQEVHKELGLSKNQSSHIIRSLKANGGSQAEYEAVYDSAIKSLTPAQNKRFAQLQLQRQGPIGILRCDVSAALGFDDDFRDSMLMKMDEFSEKDYEYQRMGDKKDRSGKVTYSDGAVGHAFRVKLWKERDRWLLSCLSQVQRAKWNQLQGPVFKDAAPTGP